MTPLFAQRERHARRQQVLLDVGSNLLEGHGLGVLARHDDRVEAPGPPVVAVLDREPSVGRDAEVLIALVDANGKRVLESRRAPIAYYQTRDWQRGELLKAYYDLKLPEDAGGELSLMLGLNAQDLKLVGKMQVTR